MKYNITYNKTNPTKEYKINVLEESFFNTVYEEIGEGINIIRMSDGMLEVFYQSYYVGKIKLQGRKHKMQILKGLYDIKWIEGNINDFLPHIKDWKKYIEWVIK